MVSNRIKEKHGFTTDLSTKRYICNICGSWVSIKEFCAEHMHKATFLMELSKEMSLFREDHKHEKIRPSK